MHGDVRQSNFQFTCVLVTWLQIARVHIRCHHDFRERFGNIIVSLTLTNSTYVNKLRIQGFFNLTNLRNFTSTVNTQICDIMIVCSFSWTSPCVNIITMSLTLTTQDIRAQKEFFNLTGHCLRNFNLTVSLKFCHTTSSYYDGNFFLRITFDVRFARRLAPVL